jgi:hypothetical protein
MMFILEKQKASRKECQRKQCNRKVNTICTLSSTRGICVPSPSVRLVRATGSYKEIRSCLVASPSAVKVT